MLGPGSAMVSKIDTSNQNSPTSWSYPYQRKIKETKTVTCKKLSMS